FFILRPPPSSTLLPYTTLFRSGRGAVRRLRGAAAAVLGRAAGAPGDARVLAGAPAPVPRPDPLHGTGRRRLGAAPAAALRGHRPVGLTPARPARRGGVRAPPPPPGWRRARAASRSGPRRCRPAPRSRRRRRRSA